MDEFITYLLEEQALAIHLMHYKIHQAFVNDLISAEAAKVLSEELPKDFHEIPAKVYKYLKGEEGHEKE